MAEVIVKVGDEMLRACEQVVWNTEFEMMQEDIRYILRTVMEDVEAQSKTVDPKPAVREHLESLGYR